MSEVARAAVDSDPGDHGAVQDQEDRGGGTGGPRASATAGKPTFRDVFGVTEFRALWLAQLLSVAGDHSPGSP